LKADPEFVIILEELIPYAYHKRAVQALIVTHTKGTV